MATTSPVQSREGANLPRPSINPFGSLHREIDRLFDEFARGLGIPGTNLTNLMPKMDVAESDKTIDVTVELPGLERKDVEISLEDNMLVIRGEKKTEQEQKDESKNYRVAERSYGAFYRMIELPRGVDPSRVQATMSNGVLKITVPKPAQSGAKKIEVKEAA